VKNPHAALSFSGRHFLIPFLISLLLSLASASAKTAVETLESPALRLEVNTEPYSFRVLERSGGAVLLTQSGGTSFRDHAHSAKSASDVIKSANSLRLSLRLSESQETAQVTFTFIKPELLQVHLSFNDKPPAEIREEFLDQGEHYYGLWEYSFGGNIDNRGADRDFTGFQHMPDVNFANARAPFYMTSGKYAIYVESTAQGHFSIAQAGKTSFSFKEAQLTYDVIYGPNYPDLLNRYNSLAGPPIMPPTWAFGSIWWRDDHHEDLRRVRNAQEKVIEDADKLRDLHIPAGSIWLDRPYGTGERGWGNMDFDESFPDPPKMIRDLSARGMNLLLWIANRCSNQLFQEGTAKGYLFPFNWPASDVRRPQVYAWFKEQLNRYVRLGIKGYKIDRGEENEMPDSFVNQNAILFPQLAAEGLRDAYGDDFLMFTRNTNDTARKYTAVWNGDTRSTFGGLAASVKNALRTGMIGFPMWGSDTGGYIRVPDKELFARWLEFSAFSPMMEILIGPKRTIWDDYDDELVAIARTYVAAHHDLIPYTQSLMHEAVRSGMPVMRPLILAYPGDQKLYDTWDEYLYGSDLLIAPVTQAGAIKREVYLPAGRWMDYNDKRSVYSGGSTIEAEAPLDTLPLFVRAGAIIPRGDIVRLNNNWDARWKPELRIEIFPSTKSSRFDYYIGKEVRTITTFVNSSGITVKVEDLGTDGILEVYCRGVRAVIRNGDSLNLGSGFQYDQKAQKLGVSFSGATVLEIQSATGMFAGKVVSGGGRPRIANKRNLVH
jgi:alpha-D-xyloside xylohydrolase